MPFYKLSNEKYGKRRKPKELQLRLQLLLMVCISRVLTIARFTCSSVANRNDTLRKTKISLNYNNMTNQDEKFVKHNSCMQCMFSVIVLEP